MTLTLDEIVVGDAPASWAAAGFAVDPDGGCRIGTVRIRLAGTGRRGIQGWALGGFPAERADLDGVPTVRSPGPPEPGPDHPNGVTGVDHAVLMSPNLARTVAALADLGLTPRRERDGELGGAPIRQVFFWLGATILEVVGAPDAAGDGPSSLWGLTLVVRDIDEAAAYFGEHTSPVKDAVQPGRRITTLRHRDLDLSVRTALITPHG